MNLPAPIGSIINDRYLIERVLGEGGMGVVVLAKHRVLDQKVAIKFLRRGPTMDEKAVERFVKEAQAAAKLTSEYVARVHDVAVLKDGSPYIVMEYLEGQTLAVLLGSGPMPVRDVTRFGLQMCEVLAETHAANIVHGDLKPENIYIAGAGNARKVKLLDFGVSKVAFEDPSSSAVVMGTPAYMAPEQIDTGTTTSRSDIFAFGAVLYEMLSGKTAFGSGSADDIRGKMGLGAKAIERADLPPGLEGVVMRCLEVDPSKRPINALQLAAALEPFAPPESSVQRINHISAPVVVREAQKARRHAATVVVSSRRGTIAWIAAVFVGVLVAGVVIGLGVFMRRAEQTPTTAAIGEPPPLPPPSLSVAAPELSVAVSAEPAPPPPSASVAAVVPSAVPSAKPLRPRRSTKPVEADRFGTRK